MVSVPLFSIIVPIYMVEKELPKCIESLLSQSYKDIEIILVDDGSPDKCPEICDSYSYLDYRIKVIHKPNGGLSDARNEGIRLAKGRYIMLVDADDYIDLDSCERFSHFIASGADIYIGLLKNEDGSLYSKKSTAIIGNSYIGEDYFVKYNSSIIACSVASIYKNSFLKNNNICFIKGRYHEDNDFTPRVYLAASSVVYTGIDFYNRCSREESITQKKDKRKNLEDILYICQGLSFFAKSLTNNKARKVLSESICNSYLYMFRNANIYQYKNIDTKKYVDRKLVFNNGSSLKNRMKALLFIISPRTYTFISNKVWSNKIGWF